MPSLKAQNRNGEQWKLLRESVEAILKRFERDQTELTRRAQAAQPDGFPAGGDGGRSSEVANPTLGAVLNREHVAESNPAVRALKAFYLALDTLEAADRHRAGAFPPEPKPAEPDGWCESCLRIKWHSPIDTSRYAKTNRNCSWCSTWLSEQREQGRPGFLPPVWVMRKRARGERIYDMDVTKAVAEFEASVAQAARS